MVGSSGLDYNFWRGRKVFVTGHTGFKGGWLIFILSQLGSRVAGYALEPEDQLGSYCAIAEGSVQTTIGDIRDREAFHSSLSSFAPEIVIHMAAQPLVLDSIRDPTKTFSTNIQGTETVLESLRHSDTVKVCLNVTTDKVYLNTGSGIPFVETDPLGGKDPYSASKACSELLTRAYFETYFQGLDLGVATARAGNVIGGGDWASDRIVPDFFRAVRSNQPLVLRNPSFKRPWQHVFEPLIGYLLLCERLFADPGGYSGPWNFGPDPSNSFSVSEVAQWFNASTSRPTLIDEQQNGQSIEAKSLALSSVKAEQNLGWRCRLSLEETLELTRDWYNHQLLGRDVRKLAHEQLDWFLTKF